MTSSVSFILVIIFLLKFQSSIKSEYASPESCTLSKVLFDENNKRKSFISSAILTSPDETSSRSLLSLENFSIKRTVKSRIRQSFEDRGRLSSLNSVIAAGVSSAKGTSSILSSVFNLSKTILGAGILSLPAAVASFSDDRSSLPLACGLLLIMGAISAYSFSSIGQACHQHHVSSFNDAWAKSVNPSSGPVISFMITLKTLFACLAYTIIIGDSFSSLLKAFHAPLFLSNREVVMWILTSTIVLPLCLLKSLDALKYTSILGLSGILYCALFMGIRLFDKSYTTKGKFFETIPTLLRPSFNERGTIINEKVFILLSTIATAYVAHYNAPKFWTELKDQSIPRYNTVVASAFTFAALMYLTVLIIGFNTFGGHSSGFILNNYSSHDILAIFARLAIGGGILFGYPLTFSALRDGIFELMRFSEIQRRDHRLLLTVAVLGAITAVAVQLRNLGLVLSLSGSLIGSALIYIIPAIMNIYNIPIRSNNITNSSTMIVKAELLFNYFIVMMGIAVAVVGVKTTLQGAGH